MCSFLERYSDFVELKHELIPSWVLSDLTSGKLCSSWCTWCLYNLIQTCKNSTVLCNVNNIQEEAIILTKSEFSLPFGLHSNSNIEWKSFLQVTSFSVQCVFTYAGLWWLVTVSARAGVSEQKLKISNPWFAWSYLVFWVQGVWNCCTRSWLTDNQ